MRNILCYGDSNTWGVNTEDHFRRLDANQRWTGLLAKQLGDQYRVLEAGLPGRTTVFNDPFSPVSNGEQYLEVTLAMHVPIDLLILMLGTNDLKEMFNATPQDIAWGIERLILKARSLRSFLQEGAFQILVVSPIHMIQPSDGLWRYGFTENSVRKSEALAGALKEMTDQYGCAFMDASLYAHPSAVDGVHMVNEDHAALAAAFAKKIRGLLSQNND